MSDVIKEYCRVQENSRQLNAIDKTNHTYTKEIYQTDKTNKQTPKIKLSTNKQPGF